MPFGYGHLPDKQSRDEHVLIHPIELASGLAVHTFHHFRSRPMKHYFSILCLLAIGFVACETDNDDNCTTDNMTYTAMPSTGTKPADCDIDQIEAWVAEGTPQ